MKMFFLYWISKCFTSANEYFFALSNVAILKRMAFGFLCHCYLSVPLDMKKKCTYIEGMVNWCFSQGFCGFLAKYCLYFHFGYKWIEDTWHENQPEFKLICICQSYCKLLIRNRCFYSKKSSIDLIYK